MGRSDLTQNSSCGREVACLKWKEPRAHLTDLPIICGYVREIYRSQLKKYHSNKATLYFQVVALHSSRFVRQVHKYLSISKYVQPPRTSISPIFEVVESNLSLLSLEAIFEKEVLAAQNAIIIHPHSITMQDIISEENVIQRNSEMSQHTYHSWIQDPQVKARFYTFARDCTSPLSEYQRPSTSAVVMATCAIIRDYGLNQCTAAQLKIDVGGREAQNYVWFTYEVVLLMSEARNGECLERFYADLEAWCLVALELLEVFRYQKQIGILPSEEVFRKKALMHADYSIYRGSYKTEFP